MQQAVILFGGQRWGKEYVADMVRETGADIVWPNEWQRSKAFENVTIVALDDFVAEEALAMAQKLDIAFYAAQSHNLTFQKHRLRALWNQLATETQNAHFQPVPFQLVLPGVIPTVPFAFPVIIKPNAYSGSVGVRLVTDAHQITAELQQLRQVLKEEQARFAGEFEVSQDIIIEQAIERKPLPNCQSEFTLHMLSRNGQHHCLATSQKQIAPGSYIEVGHTVPAVDIPPTILQWAEAAALQLLQQLQVQHCISNWEFIATPANQIALVEGQLRPSGDRLMQLIQLATGINPFGALLYGETKPTLAHKARISWLGAADIVWVGDKYTIPDLPIGWQTIIDEAGLKNNPHWPGPVDWYNRYVAIIGRLY